MNFGLSLSNLHDAADYERTQELFFAYFQEDQLGSLGLVTNVIILWNTLYMESVLNQFRQGGYTMLDKDVPRLSPLIHEHINMLGR
jgi:TnpA family transposase